MILPLEIEKNFIDFDVCIRRESRNAFSEDVFDDIKVYWNKRSLFGKITRKTTVYSFERYKDLNKYHLQPEAESFIKRLEELKKPKKNILENLKKEFSGNDDFSLGVQHAISIIEKEYA